MVVLYIFEDNRCVFLNFLLLKTNKHISFSPFLGTVWISVLPLWPLFLLKYFINVAVGLLGYCHAELVIFLKKLILIPIKTKKNFN